MPCQPVFALIPKLPDYVIRKGGDCEADIVLLEKCSSLHSFIQVTDIYHAFLGVLNLYQSILLFFQYTDSHYRSSLIDALANTVTPGVSMVTTNRSVLVYLLLTLKCVMYNSMTR